MSVYSATGEVEQATANPLETCKRIGRIVWNNSKSLSTVKIARLWVVSHGAEKKVSVRTLNPFGPCLVEVVCSQLIIFRGYAQIGKSCEEFTEFLEQSLRFDFGKDLLTDWAYQLHPCLLYQFYQFLKVH